MFDLLYPFLLPHLRCVFEVLAFSTAGFGLLAVWVALGHGSWRIRVVVACLAVAMLLPIRAYEPALLLIAGVSALSFVLALFRHWASQFEACRATNVPASRSRERKVLVVATFAGCLVAGLALIGLSKIARLGWYDWLLVLTFAGPLTVVLVNAFGQRVLHGRWVVSRKPLDETRQVQFSLRGAFFVIGIMAAACGMATIALQRSSVVDWRGFSISAICLVAIACAACSVTISRRWYWRCLSIALLVTFLFATPKLHGWWGSDWMRINGWLELMYVLWPQDATEGLAAYLLASTLIFLVGVFTLHVAGWIQTTPEPSNRSTIATVPARFAVVSALVGVYLSLTPLYLQMLGQFEFPRTEVSGDGRYSQLVAEANELRRINGPGLTLADIRKRSLTQTADEVAWRYQRIDELLQEPVSVPLDLDDRTAGGPHQLEPAFPEIQTFLWLARAWQKESEAARLSKRFDESVHYGILNVRLGSGMGVGGFAVHSHYGAALEGLGCQELIRVRHVVSTDTATDLLRRLQWIDSQREPPAAIVARMNAWYDRAETWRFRLSMCAPSVLTGLSPQENPLAIAAPLPALEGTMMTMMRRDAIHRLLMAELALRLHRDRHAVYPSELQDLVPEFLSVVPVDPYSGQPLIYRRADKGYVIYSVGRDRDDDGGKFGTWTQAVDGAHDLDLETMTRETQPETK